MLLEAFNLAALWRVPVLFVCENNGYATTMPARSAVAGSITGRARAFGIPAFSIDGQDPEKVLAATTATVVRARAGKGPTFPECRTYRFDAHHTFEHRARLNYRSTEELSTGRSRDPVEIQGARLAAEDRTAVDAEVEALLDAAAGIGWAVPIPIPPPRSSTSTPRRCPDDGGDALMPKLSYLKALNRALGDELDRDPDVFLLGEDIRAAASNLTAWLFARFGPDRVLDTPLSEQAFTNFATGAALAGLRR